jgi:hypothetical protein
LEKESYLKTFISSGLVQAFPSGLQREEEKQREKFLEFAYKFNLYKETYKWI